MPDAGMGEAAEEAGDGIRLAVVLREGLPRGAGLVGEVEDGIQPGTGIGGAAALGGEGREKGLEGGPGGVGEGGPGGSGGEARHGGPLRWGSGRVLGIQSFCQDLGASTAELIGGKRPQMPADPQFASRQSRHFITPSSSKTDQLLAQTVTAICQPSTVFTKQNVVFGELRSLLVVARLFPPFESGEVCYSLRLQP